MPLDLTTDSWSHLQLPYMRARHRELQRRAARHPVALEQALAALFPFRHFIVTPRGRDAEGLLFAALAQTGAPAGGCAVQNILFHTARDEQCRAGQQPVELPSPFAFTTDDYPFKGEVEVTALEEILASRPVSVIFVEALSNGVGGQPISINNLRAVQALARRYHVPLYLDATRALENCVFTRARDAACAGHSLREILHTLLACCDGMTLSLVKDYGVIQGGLLATNNPELYRHAAAQAGQQWEATGGCAPELAQALVDWDYIEHAVQVRMRQVQRIGAALNAAGFPVRAPVGGHCVILDPDLPAVQPSVPDYINRLHRQTGLHGAAHWSGWAPAYQRPAWIRLALPIGMPDEAVSEALSNVYGTNQIAVSS